MTTSAEQLDIVFTHLSALVHSYGAPTVDMAEQVLQRSAIGNIVGGGFVLFLGVVALLVAFLLIRFVVLEEQKDIMEQRLGLQISAGIGGILFTLGGLAFTVTGVISLCDVWAWTALSNPQLALAHTIFGSMQ